MEYAQYIIYAVPLFEFPMFFSSFLRNDNAPSLVMSAVITGGIINIIGDYVLVFPSGLGMRGAAIATTLDTLIQSAIMAAHFFRASCGLKLEMPNNILRDSVRILTTGASLGILDFSTIILVIIANNQIMTYFGAGNSLRVREVFRLGIVSVGIMCVVFAGICKVFPVDMLKVLMSASPEVLAEAPHIVRIYSLILIPMSFNIIAIYYLQSIMRNRAAMILAIMKSIALSGTLLVILPLIFGLDGVILALPVSEVVTFAATFACLHRGL